MKKGCIYILLFFYVAVQLKPLTAVLQDTFAHTFFRMQHMATIHKENGRYHLHMELKDMTEKEASSSSHKAPNQQKTDKSFSTHLLEEFDFQFAGNNPGPKSPTGSNAGMVSVFLPISSPPPKA